MDGRHEEPESESSAFSHASPPRDEEAFTTKGSLQRRRVMSSSSTLSNDFTQLAFSTLLIDPIPARDALTRALSLAGQLVPALRDARLYVAPNVAGEEMILESGRDYSTRDDDFHLPAGAREFLSSARHGEVATREDTSWIALVGSSGMPLGLLVGKQLQPSMREKNPQLGIVLAHLAALLARWQQETEIHQLREDLARESQERDNFISLTAHELRSPLTSVKGYAQLLTRLARKTPLPDAMMRSVQAIEMQSVRISEMVGELLDASRAQRGKLEIMPSPTNLTAVVSRVVERRRAYHAQHDIRLEISDENLSGIWDMGRVEQIIRDLIDNAARYSPEGGVITVSVWREDERAVLSVRDEGSGIAEDEKGHIFEYLYRAPRMHERNLSGLGLGLYICRELARLMGGNLALYATSMEPPSGSEFRLYLPLASV